MAKKTRKKHAKRKPSTYKGLPLIDADEDMPIEISKSDVRRARKNDPANCAAAVATTRMTNMPAEVHISRTYVKDTKNKCWIRFLTPQAISREITSFDRSSIFEPGNYVLKAPVGSSRIGHYHHGESGREYTKRKRPPHYTVNVRQRAKRGSHGG